MLPVNTCAKLRGRVKCTVLKRSEVKSAYRLRLNDIEMTNLARKRERERERTETASACNHLTTTSSILVVVMVVIVFAHHLQCSKIPNAAVTTTATSTTTTTTLTIRQTAFLRCHNIDLEASSAEELLYKGQYLLCTEIAVLLFVFCAWQQVTSADCQCSSGACRIKRHYNAILVPFYRLLNYADDNFNANIDNMAIFWHCCCWTLI